MLKKRSYKAEREKKINTFILEINSTHNHKEICRKDHRKEETKNKKVKYLEKKNHFFKKIFIIKEILKVNIVVERQNGLFVWLY